MKAKQKAALIERAADILERLADDALADRTRSQFCIHATELERRKGCQYCEGWDDGIEAYRRAVTKAKP